MAMPIGTPIPIESSVATVIMASVRMVSAPPKYPINKGGGTYRASKIGLQQREADQHGKNDGQ